MWHAMRIINYVQRFTLPEIKEAYYPNRAFKSLEVAPDRDDWSMVCHRITGGEAGGHLHYAKSLRPPVWGQHGLARLLYVTVHQNVPVEVVGRDKTKCSDRLCVNPEHMKSYALDEPLLVVGATRSCEVSRKLGYTEAKAIETVARMRKIYKGRVAKKRIQAYLCPSPFCKQWHITTHAKLK